jgi:hypothetical protein
VLPSAAMGPLGNGILVALLRLPVFHEDLEEVGRIERMTTIAYAIESATIRATCGDAWPELGCRRIWKRSREELASLLVMKAWKETALCRRWHAGDCRGSECDHGTSAGLWQLKPTPWMTEWPWDELAQTGFIPTAYSAWYAARILSCGLKTCGSVEGAVAIYATGSSCEWDEAAERVSLAVRIRRDIKRARG